MIIFSNLLIKISEIKFFNKNFIFNCVKGKKIQKESIVLIFFYKLRYNVNNIDIRIMKGEICNEIALFKLLSKSSLFVFVNGLVQILL